MSNFENIKVRDFENIKGVKPIHLFNEIWGVGRLKGQTNINYHRIIYSPIGKEFHLYGSEAKQISSKYYRTEEIDSAKAKIFILTNILDERKNWCFDLKCLPKLNDDIKVVYDNGLIKNIIFSGQWDELNITLIRNNKNKKIKPFCWRLDK